MAKRGGIILVVVTLIAVVALALYIIASSEVFLSVPQEMTGGVVLANGRQIAVIESPEMVYLRFWRRPQELTVVKREFKPVRIAINCPGECYLEITQDQLAPAR